MTSQAVLLKEQEAVERDGFKLTAAHFDPDKDVICCEGKYEWYLETKGLYGGWGMHRGSYFLDPGDDMMFFVHWYEHSRGGHCDPGLTAIDLPTGKALWTTGGYAGDLSSALLYNKKLWYFDRDSRKGKDNRMYARCNLHCVDLRTGAERFDRPVMLPDHFKPAPLTKEGKVMQLYCTVKWLEKQGKVWVEIKRSGYGDIPDQKETLPAGDFVRRV